MVCLCCFGIILYYLMFVDAIINFPSITNDHNIISRLPTWIITNSTEYYNNIHRFFDSSPFSPSSRYIAYTRLPSFISIKNSKDNKNYAEVIVSDLKIGKHIVIDITLAWDSQVGAQVQWGATDDELFYNILSNLTIPNEVNSNKKPFGVVYNITSNTYRKLDCSIYHIRNDGKYGISPNLLKIFHTQQGYGIHGIHITSSKNNYAPSNDGIFITNIKTGTCKLLISLKKLLLIANMDLTQTPVYGFHTKWSTDGKLIMFIVRTLERSLKTASKKYIRVQHMFVLNLQLTFVKRILSWSSSPFIPFDIDCNNNNYYYYNNNNNNNNNNNCNYIVLRDGNHPNWIPNTHKISMNLETSSMKTTDTSYKNIITDLFDNIKINKRKRSNWSIVSIDIDTITNYYQYKYSTIINISSLNIDLNHNNHSMKNTYQNDINILNIQQSYTIGTGHPNFDLTGNYVITDAYSKELHLLNHPTNYIANNTISSNKLIDKNDLRMYYSPLRLIEIKTQKEIWLLQVQIDRNKHSYYNYLSKLLTATSSLSTSLLSSSSSSTTLLMYIEDKSWRCDMHITWSRNYEYIAFNGRSFGKERQLFIASIEKNLSKYF